MIGEVETALVTLHQIREGAFRITRQRFRNALKRSIRATADYADGCWIPFQDSPMHYICSRSHPEQQLELVRVCLRLARKTVREERLAKEAAATVRPIGGGAA